MTYKHLLKRTEIRSLSRANLMPQDGLAVTSIKFATRRFAQIWSWLFYFRLLSLLEKPVVHISDSVFGRRLSPRQHFSLAVDVYKLIMDCLLLLTYFLAVQTAMSGLPAIAKTAVLTACVIFSTGRLGEVLTIVVYLYFNNSYKPKSSVRAVANTLWHYLELTTTFAVIFVAVEHLQPNAFAVNSSETLLSDSFLAPWYFSFCTVTTLGYGDFTPNVGVSRLLACVEIMLGFVLLLIILQRSFNTGNTPSEKFELADLIATQDGFLENGSRSYRVGAIVIIQNARGEYLVVRKAPKEGYEFSNNLCFPGGMARTTISNSDPDNLQTIISSVTARVLAETGVKIDPQKLVAGNSFRPIVTSYTVQSKKRYTAVIPFHYQLQEPTALQPTDDSISEAIWLTLQSEDFTSFSPASAIFAATTIWASQTLIQRRKSLEELSEHIRFCQSAAADVGFTDEANFEILYC